MKKIYESDKIKLALLEYYRFERSMLVGTEDSECDILVESKTSAEQKTATLTEIEVKTSIQDLKKDFKDKQTKHFHINNLSYKIDYFYFCIPYDLYEKAEKIISEQGKYYGIITYIPNPEGKQLVFKKKAKKVSKNCTYKFKPYYLYKRLSSEVTSLRSQRIKLIEEIGKPKSITEFLGECK